VGFCWRISWFNTKCISIFTKKGSTADEHLEIVGLVESRSKEIKEFFLKFNDNATN